MRPAVNKPHFNRRYLLVVVLMVLSVYVLLPQVGDFRSSWHLLRHPIAGWTILAVGLTLSTYLSGATTYWLLALRPLKYCPTVIVQLAAMFINRLLPGGIGALGANFAYLRQYRHSRAQAASVVAINNLLGGLGHGLIVACTLLFSSRQTTFVPSYGHTASIMIKVALAVVLILGIIALMFGRRKIKHEAVSLLGQLSSYSEEAWRLPAALGSSLILTLANVLCLSACAMALGVHLPFVVILLIFTFGISTGTATPTPGGLGGFEAGLAAGFITYHVYGPAALAIALLYRLVSYWLPLIIGAGAFAVSQRRGYFAS